MSQAIPNYLLNLNAPCPFDGYLPYDILFVFIIHVMASVPLNFGLMSSLLILGRHEFHDWLWD